VRLAATMIKADLDPAVPGVREGEGQMVIGHRQDGRALAFAPFLRGAAVAGRAVAVRGPAVAGNGQD
jgi:hypothetical protein